MIIYDMRVKSKLLWIPGGLGFFFACLPFARLWLPEWRSEELSSKSSFLQRYQEVIAKAGFMPVQENARVDLFSWVHDYPNVFDLMGKKGSDWLVQQRRTMIVEVSQLVTQGSKEGWLLIDFSLNGKPWYARWSSRRLAAAGPPPISSSAPPHRPLTAL